MEFEKFSDLINWTSKTGNDVRMIEGPNMAAGPPWFLINEIPTKDPWEWYIYLHENHKDQPNVGKYTIHGSFSGLIKNHDPSSRLHIFWNSMYTNGLPTNLKSVKIIGFHGHWAPEHPKLYHGGIKYQPGKTQIQAVRLSNDFRCSKTIQILNIPMEHTQKIYQTTPAL